MESKPDYSSYSYNNLVDAFNHVDSDKYPDRFEELKHRIAHFDTSNSNQPEHINATIIGTQNHFKFTGKTGEFFSIWTVNVLLSILTLGIYSAWAKVRTQTYFYGNTFLDGSSFRYHAKPTQILKGRIIAFVFFMAYYFSGYINLTAVAIIFVAIALLMPAFIVMSMAFRMRNSSYRNVRFNFDKDLKQAYGIFLVPFILIAVYLYTLTSFEQDMNDQVKQIGVSLWSLILLPIVISLLYPLFEYLLVKFRVNHSSFGKSVFEFSSDVGSFYVIYIVAAFVFIPGVFIIGFVVSALIDFLTALMSNGAEVTQTYTVYIMMIPMAALYLWVFAYIQTKRTNLIYNDTQIQGHQLQSNLQVSSMYYLYLTNTIAIACTLGLMAPWAMIRTAQYKASCTSVMSQESLNDFVVGQSKEQSAYGEEIGEMFDIDLGL